MNMSRAKLLFLAIALALAALVPAPTATAQVCNLRIVTDASPDYSDMDSLIHSISSGWTTDEEKLWAVFYWNHKARRQTNPIMVHGFALTDPIRQFNDYGFMMCSTIAGANCSIWDAMGYQVKYWDVNLHTVAEVKYGDKWHMYDNSGSCFYTLCDGKTIASIDDLSKEVGCELSGGKAEKGHVALYHNVMSTSPLGYLTGCDMNRRLSTKTFMPPLRYRPYYNDWDRGHRYILNIRDGEVYTRFWSRQDAASPNAVAQGEKSTFKADPAYFIANGQHDAEALNPRYRIRGNGVRTFKPILTKDGLDKTASIVKGVAAVDGGLAPAAAGLVGEVVFKIEGANVITSTTISGRLSRKADADAASVAVSTNNGLTWKDVFTADKTGEQDFSVKLVEDVNGSYEVLVKVSLTGKAAAADAMLKAISFDTITQVNTKTQPKLNIGKNTVYVDRGSPTESIVFWPELQDGKYKPFVFEEVNTAFAKKANGYQAVLFADKGSQEAYVVFKVEAPRDITSITYGGRFYNRTNKAHCDLLHSFDGGQTWAKTWTLAKTDMPWDVLHSETVTDVPAGTRSVLFKYLWNGNDAGMNHVGLYAVRMEVSHKVADEAFKPLEVTYSWSERQKDYSLVKRSHTELVDKTPHSYTINVGGEDHPVMDSLQINLKGATTQPAVYGYSDSKDAGGQKYVGNWVTYGKNLALGKKYTLSVPSKDNWDASDAGGTALTDGLVGAYYTGAGVYPHGPIWTGGDPQIVLDLEKAQKFTAVRFHTGGYDWQDALKGQNKDRVEVFTSADGEKWTSQGEIALNLRWKDLPVNLFWPDEETLCAYNYDKVFDKPVEARYVKFAMKVGPGRYMSVTEVQVLDEIKADKFDLRIAPPKAFKATTQPK